MLSASQLQTLTNQVESAARFEPFPLLRIVSVSEGYFVFAPICMMSDQRKRASRNKLGESQNIKNVGFLNFVVIGWSHKGKG